MGADAHDVLEHTLGLIFDCVPVDEMAADRAAAMLGIGPRLAVEICGREIIVEQGAHDLVGKRFHTFRLSLCYPYLANIAQCALTEKLVMRRKVSLRCSKNISVSYP